MRLTTARLLVRDLVAVDWRDLLAIESDPEVVRYQPFEPRTAEDAHSYVDRAVLSAMAVPREAYDLALTAREANTVIGRCGLHITNAEAREAVVWYMLQRSLWGRGYIPEAMRALVDYGFTTLRLHRVWADCDPRNHPSSRVLEKLGMRREAHLVENAWVKGEWTDSLIYAVLDREWPTALDLAQ